MMMKRSALYYLQQRAGASFTNHHGWELPGFFMPPEKEAVGIRKGVGLADLSHLFKFDVQEEPGERSWPLGAHHYLLMTESPANPPSGAIDVSSVYTCLRLCGPRSRDVLNKLTSLNVSSAAFPNLSCAQATVAHVHAIVIRDDIGPMLAFYLLVSREYAESVWESTVHAGHEFHLCAFGVTTLQSLHK